MTRLNKKNSVIPACVRRESNPSRCRFPLTTIRAINRTATVRGNDQKALRLRNSQNGFTVLELLVAIIIILVLATASIAMISRIEVYANIAQAKTEITQISMAIEMEKYDTGSYTLIFAEMGKTSAPEGINARAWKGPYLTKDFSLDDPWEIPYTLTRADGWAITPVSAKNPYLITSCGTDKLPGGTGLNSDIVWHSDYAGFQD